MLTAMVNVKDSEICEIRDPALKKKAKKIFQDILDSVKYLGVFLSQVMYPLYSDEYNKKIEDFFSMCIILNSLLRSKYVFYCYTFYLSKVLIFKNKQFYLQKRQRSKSRFRAFDDLIYMNKFLIDEASQKMVRSHSVQFLRDSSSSKHFRNLEKIEKMTPKGMHNILKSSVFLDKEELENLGARGKRKAANVQMDIHEFLVHLNLHLKMNLDYVFSGNLKEILAFFTAIEDFMEKTFGNKELEVKIDLMRLIIRMTNATLFIEKIFMLNKMRIKYLEYWQTFSLFTQVMLSELRNAEVRC